MSYTTIMSVAPKQEPEYLLKLRNSHLAAPFIWGQFARMYYGVPQHQYNEILDYLWPRWMDPGIPKSYRAVLMMTFDLAYIRKEHYARAAADICQFLHETVGNGHWLRIAEFYESKPNVDAIAIWQTSVSENPFEGPWNEELDQYELIDWNTTSEIYDDLRTLEDSASHSRP